MELQTTNFDILETDASLTNSDERLSSRLTTEPLVGHINTIYAGLYAVVETFRKKANDDDDADDEYSNTLIGRFVRDEVDGEPTLYLCHVTGLVGPLSGIPDIVRNNANKSRSGPIPATPKEYLFLMKRRSEWPECWNSVIKGTTQQHAGARPDDVIDSSSEDEDETGYNLARRQDGAEAV
jgi:hypothetical protein